MTDNDSLQNNSLYKFWLKATVANPFLEEQLFWT